MKFALSGATLLQTNWHLYLAFGVLQSSSFIVVNFLFSSSHKYLLKYAQPIYCMLSCWTRLSKFCIPTSNGTDLHFGKNLLSQLFYFYNSFWSGPQGRGWLGVWGIWTNTLIGQFKFWKKNLSNLHSGAANWPCEWLSESFLVIIN